jgi:hypothetical protein
MQQLLKDIGNTITSIDTNDGRTLTAHADKASFIWEEYRSRLSCSNHTQMVFNLQELIQEQDLQNITTPFTKEDIDDVIKEMFSDKAPGPDGFNGTFIKNAGLSSKKTSTTYVLTSLLEMWIYNPSITHSLL